MPDGKKPVYVVAEVGQNHNADLGIAKKLIQVAVAAGCNAVKFQKRTPELCVPLAQQSQLRETPWGRMTYLDYRKRLEFGHADYDAINACCRAQKIDWFASVWDEPSVDFMVHYSPPYLKIPSAQLTNSALLRKVSRTGVPIILSTGMSTTFEFGTAIQLLRDEKALQRTTLLHTVSAYPCRNDVNLRVITTLKAHYPDLQIGYSGHERGLQISIAAVALGATMIERHITLDRTLWGTDHAASLEPHGLTTLVRDIRIVEEALGDGVRKLHADEIEPRRRLRGET